MKNPSQRHRATRTAFTLLEMMLVVVIIGMVLSIALVNLKGSSKKAKVTAATADIDGSFRTALNLYEMDNGKFPTTEQGLNALYQKPTGEPVPHKWNQYLERPPPKDPWGNEYVYRCPGTHNTSGYDLSSLAHDGVESEDDIKNW